MNLVQFWLHLSAMYQLRFDFTLAVDSLRSVSAEYYTSIDAGDEALA